MTKINDNGQMEFTFEELDLTGDYYRVVREYSDCFKGISDSLISKEERSYLVARCELLHSVRDNLIRLMGWV